MRLAYCNGGISISETFIYDLSTALSQKVESFEFLGGTPLTIPVPFSYRNLHYIKRYNAIERKIYSLLSSERRFKTSTQYAKRKLAHIRDYDVAYIDYGTTAICFDEILVNQNTPYVVHFHGHDITSALNNSIYRKLIVQVFKNAAFVIAASHHIKRLLVLAGCPAEKINVIRYGLPADSIKPLVWSQRKKNAPSIIFIGRLTHKKNPQALIHAFEVVKKTVRDARLNIVGDGSLLNDCKELVNKLKLKDAVTFYGAMPRNQIFEILNQQWIYAQHSVTSYHGDQEGFALSLAEAALHEIPVVSTLHNGISENVIDGVTGFLVQEYNYEAMAERIIQLIQNPDLAERMGKAGREHIQKMCVHEERVEKITDLLNKAIQQHKYA